MSSGNRGVMLLRRSFLFVLGLAVAFGWAGSSRAQVACMVDRGLDPLDILDSSTRHNVFLILDLSGSMRATFPFSTTGQSKATEAVAVIRDVLYDPQFQDNYGRPLVNWGFSYFVGQNQNIDDTCAPTSPCSGVASDRVDPSFCNDTRVAVTNLLNRLPGPARRTADGVSVDQMSQRIASGYLTNLKPNQRNFIVLLTDGFDTCECGRTTNDGSRPALRGSSTSPAPSYPSFKYPPREDPPSCAWDTSGSPFLLTSDAAAVDGYNTGLKMRAAFQRMNGGKTDGSKGDIYVVGMGLTGTDACLTDPETFGLINHMAWEGSGANFGRPDAHPALFADNRTQLKRQLSDILARIGVPSTEVTLGPSVVGSVWERIPAAYPSGQVTANQVFADASAANPSQQIAQARNFRFLNQNNVLFTSSAETPGFRGHLRAYNIYTAGANNTRTADFTQLWDAGAMLRLRDPADRTLFFNRRGETQSRPFVAGAAGPQPADLGLDLNFLKDFGGGAKTLNDARDIVVNVVRGYRLSIHPTTGTLYRPDGKLNFSTKEGDAPNALNTWKLFEPAASGPAIVGSPPRSPDAADVPRHNDKYRPFYFARLNRQTVAHLPTNDGVLHAFRADNGYELYGFIPDDVLSLAPGETAGSRDTLKDFVELVVRGTNAVNNHKFLMASSPTVQDVFLRSVPGDVSQSPSDPDPGVWHTVLAFGRGYNGSFLTALDVTFPTPVNFPQSLLQPPAGYGTDPKPGTDPRYGNWDKVVVNATPTRLDDTGDPRMPSLLWNVGNREGLRDDLPGYRGVLDGLGETWSSPIMAPVRVTRMNQQNQMVTMDQWVMFVGSGYGCLRTPDVEGKQLFVLRLDDGVPHVAPFTVMDVAGARVRNALVATPAVYNPHDYDLTQDEYASSVYIGDLHGQVWKLDTSNADATQWKWTVLYRLGGDQPISAQAGLTRDPQTNRPIVFVASGGDYRVTTTQFGSFKLAAVRDTTTGGTPMKVLTGGPGNSFDYAIPRNERAYTAPVTTKNAVFLATSSVTFDATNCRSLFTSTLYAFAGLTGLGSYDIDPAAGTQTQTSLGDGKAQGSYVTADHLYVSRSGGMTAAGNTFVLGDGFKTPDDGGFATTAAVRVTMKRFSESPF